MSGAVLAVGTLLGPLVFVWLWNRAESADWYVDDGDDRS